MPQKWSAAEHEELLIHVVRTHQIRWDAVAADWRKEKGNTAPTHGAITQHLAKWKKGSGCPKNKIVANVRVDSTPRTPQTPKTTTPVHKTPSTGTKRKASSMSDDDDDDSDVDLKNVDVGHRTSLPRRSKSKSVQPSVAYGEGIDSDEDDDGGVEGETNGLDETNERVKLRRSEFESDDESDGSDFAKAFHK